MSALHKSLIYSLLNSKREILSHIDRTEPITTMSSGKEDPSDVERGSGGSKVLDRYESTLDRHTDPFAPREGKTLTWTNVNMTLVSLFVCAEICTCEGAIAGTHERMFEEFCSEVLTVWCDQLYTLVSNFR